MPAVLRFGLAFLSLWLAALPAAEGQIAFRGAATGIASVPQYRSSASAVAVTSITYRASSSSSTTGGTLTLARPAGTAANDILIASVGVSPSAAVLTPPAGWMLIRRTDNAGPTSNSLAVYWRLATGAEPVSYAWTVAGGSYTVGGIQAFSGVDTATPIDVENGQATPSSASHATPSVTTTVALAMVVASHTYASSRNWTPPAGMTDSFDQRSGANSATGQSIEGSRVLQAAAGATGTKTATAAGGAGSADAGVTHILALRPLTTTQALTIARPAGVALNDVLIASVGVTPSTATITAPAGWTLVRRIDNAGPTSNSLAVYRKVATAAELASYVWNLSGVNYGVGGVQAFFGVDTANPINAEAGQATASGRDHATPSITTTVANTLLVGSYTYASSQTWTPRTPPNPAMTESFDQPSGAASATGQSIEGTRLLQAAAGVVPAYTSRAAGAPATYDAGATHMLALRPVGTTLTIPLPAGTVANDVMIASIGVTPSSVTVSPPAGWALVNRRDNAAATSNSLLVFSRVAGGGEPAAYSWIISGNFMASGGIQSFSGVDTVTPIDVQASQSTNSSLNHATPSVTTTVANTMLVTSHTFASAATWTPPAGMSEGFDVTVPAANNATGQATEGSYVLQAIAGATGAKTATASANADRGNAHILALRPGPVITPPSGFNGCELATCTPTAPPALGYAALYTKRAGIAYTLHGVALKADGTLETGFSGNVAVDLLANINTLAVDPITNCPASQDATIALGNAAFASGRATIAGINVANAYRDVRMRFSCTAAVCGSALTRCSSDNFAIRPSALIVSSSANADATGTSVNATPTVKAGATFTLTATALASYNGTPAVDTAMLAAHAGAVQTGTLAGSFGAAAPATGVATGNFTYGEVGYFNLATNGVYDDTFTAVDQPNDCTNDFSNALVGGKYGCRFGNAVATDFFGRFIPDHFGLTTYAADSLIDRSDINTGASETCASSFTYMGEDFKTRFELSARNAANTITQNYTGGHAKFGLTNWTNFVFTGSAGTLEQGSVAPSGAWGSTAGTYGTAAVTATHRVQRPAAPAAPYTGFTVSAQPAYADGGLTVSLPASTTVHNGNTEMRFGRLRLQNALGSELRALPVPVWAEHWSGTAFIRNTQDNCTVIGAVSLSGAAPCTLTPAVSGAGSTLSSGAGTLSLAAPGVRGCADLSVTASDWLKGRWSGATYTENPRARASFGVFKDKVLYRRENF
jgi:MSHA biogenesis protein MshQ